MAVYTIESVNSNCKVEIATSSLFEMMACLRKCYILSGRIDCEPYLPTVRFDDFFKKNEKLIKKFYGRYEYGAQLAEFLVGISAPHTFNNLMEYINNVSKYEFLYYLFGRYISREEVEFLLNNSMSPLDDIRNKITSLGGLINPEQLEFAEHYDQFFAELVYLWKSFYKHCYFDLESKLGSLWDIANKRLAKDLKHLGIEKVVRKLLYDYKVPEQFPNKETKLIKFYPSYFVSPKFILIWAFGELHIIYDLKHYINENDIYFEENKVNILNYDQNKINHVSDIAKSLSEVVRIKILLFIANEEKIKSQEIANKLNITPATVSRHLSLLKQSNLIFEHKENGYNIYEINEKEIERYCSILKDMLGKKYD